MEGGGAGAVSISLGRSVGRERREFQPAVQTDRCGKVTRAEYWRRHQTSCSAQLRRKFQWLFATSIIGNMVSGWRSKARVGAKLTSLQLPSGRLATSAHYRLTDDRLLARYKSDMTPKCEVCAWRRKKHETFANLQAPGGCIYSLAIS